MSDLEGVLLSEYLLMQCINKGRVAEVYRARHRAGGNCTVAVKVFRPGYAEHKPFCDYFMAQAEKIGQLDHPHILPFLEFGEGDKLLYTITPFVHSGTLENLLERRGGRLSASQALPIMQQLCDAVQYAHDHDITHGNIKPTNVFIGADDEVLLSDFGVLHNHDSSQQSLTSIGWEAAEYAAPEQSLGVVRCSSDIYTLGILLFRMLTGQPPFTGPTAVDVLLKHVRQQPPSALALAPDISDALDKVLLTAMQKRSDDRFTSAREFSDAFSVACAPITSSPARPVTAAPEKNFLLEDDDLGTSIFEWRSLYLQDPTDMPTIPMLYSGQGRALPLRQQDLTDMPTIPMLPPQAANAPGEVSFTSTAGLPQVVAYPQEAVQHRGAELAATLPSSPHQKRAQALLKNTLPALVVILLLLGLLAALFSSFLYPG